MKKVQQDPSQDRQGTPTYIILSVLFALLIFAIEGFKESLGRSGDSGLRMTNLGFVAVGLALCFFWRRIHDGPMRKVSALIYSLGLWGYQFLMLGSPALLHDPGMADRVLLYHQMGLGAVVLSSLVMMAALLYETRLVPSLMLAGLAGLIACLTSIGSLVVQPSGEAERLDTEMSAHPKHTGQVGSPETHPPLPEHPSDEGEEFSAASAEADSASKPQPMIDTLENTSHLDAQDDQHQPTAHEHQGHTHSKPGAVVAAHPSKKALKKTSLVSYKNSKHEMAKHLHQGAAPRIPATEKNNLKKLALAAKAGQTQEGHTDSHETSDPSGTDAHQDDTTKFPSKSQSRDRNKAPTVSWEYGGTSGPKSWGALGAEFTLCETGAEQSPIDIPAEWRAKDNVRFLYKSSSFEAIDNGHTIQFNVSPGNFAFVGGRRYELKQLHFHTPSEHLSQGKSHILEAHFIHASAQGDLAIVATMIKPGSEHKEYAHLWEYIPVGKNASVKPREVTFDPRALLPTSIAVYSYPGSLTTPPCTEKVSWNIVQDVVTMSQEQINKFRNKYQLNARSVQDLKGRE